MKAVWQALVLTGAVALPCLGQAGTPGHGEPGFHGALRIGPQQSPELIRKNPELVRPLSAVEMARPLYLHVPRHEVWRWSRHCHSYDACGRPAYFVTSRWYEQVYVPHWREEQRRRDVVRRKSGNGRSGMEL